MVRFDIMDEDNNLNIRNWDYYEPTSVKGNLGLQLMSPTMPEKPFLGARSNVDHHECERRFSPKGY